MDDGQQTAQPSSGPVASTSRDTLDTPVDAARTAPPRRETVEQHLASRWRNKRMWSLPNGAQPEIIRAFQKDAFYAADLREQVEDVARIFFGSRWIQTWSKELAMLSHFALLSLTSVSGGIQTLGEEYVDIVPYWDKNKKVPSRMRRLVLAILQIVGPHIIGHAYAKFRQRWNARFQESPSQDSAEPTDVDVLGDVKVSTDGTTTASSKYSSKISALIYKTAKRIRNIELPTLEVIADDYVRAVHLTAFYLWGRYYTLANRFVGIRYTSTQKRADTGPEAEPPSYEVLGVLMAIQLCARGIRALMRYRLAQNSVPETSEQQELEGHSQEAVDSGGKEKNKGKKRAQEAKIDRRPLEEMTFDPEADDVEGDPEIAADGQDEDGPVAAQRKRCTLCLGPQKDATSTECGHVFCWKCIVGWARERYECPLCRQAVYLSRLLPLYNY